MENIIQKRHTTIRKQLMDATVKAMDNHTVSKITQKIGDVLDLSPNTVHNYMYGRCADGYTAEAILDQLKKFLKK